MKKNTKATNNAADLLRAVEADLDANYHQFDLPHSNKTIAIWYLLSVLEDNLRSLFILSADQDAAVVEHQVDRLKYSGRFALDRISKECPDTSMVELSSRVVIKIYEKTSDLLIAGLDFMGATQLCSAAHSKTLRFIEQDGCINVEFDPVHHDVRYSALELLGHMSLDALDHSARLYVWSRNDEHRPNVVDEIARSVSVAGHQVIYRYEPHLAVVLAQEMSQPDFLIPEGWRFPWGGRHETTLLINALCVRCMYHWVAVHFGSSFQGLRGGGEASILLVTTVSELVSDMEVMCSLNQKVIRQFIQYLTFGHGMQSPDPALQSIVPLGNHCIAVPCLLFLSSNYERNLLVIQARSDASTFDSLSHLFEKHMVKSLVQDIQPHWPTTKPNVTIRTSNEFEEIDLLFADTHSRTLLACELRWMLQPGDPREVQQRKKVCQEKVDQLERKVLWLRSNIISALRMMELDTSEAQTWRIEGVVVIDAFGGTLSKKPDFPIMTKKVFTQGMLAAESLQTFSAWSKSLCWLPKEEVHFLIVPQQTPLMIIDKELITLGIKKLASLPTYSRYVDLSLSEFHADYLCS